MRKSSHRPWQESSSNSEPFSYTSNTLKYFIERIAQRNDGRLLDVGPIFGINIEYLSERVRRLYVCDLFRCLNADRKADLPAGGYWRRLDWPPGSLDGVLLWNIIDRLDPAEVKELVERCHGMMKSGGFVMLLTLGEKVSPTGQDVFVLQDEYRVISLGPHYSHLPAHHRQNRDYLHLLSPFVPAKSLIYRNGIREFLFQRD